MVEHYFLDRSEKENDITLLAKKRQFNKYSYNSRERFFGNKIVEFLLRGENDILLNFLNQEVINTDIKQNENSTIVMIEYNKTLIAKLVKELESKNFLFTIL